MTRHKSAVKELRQSLKRRLRNRQSRSRMRTAVKRLARAVSAGDAETARTLLPGTLAIVDRTARVRAIHDNVAARTKSRLTRAVNRLRA